MINIKQAAGVMEPLRASMVRMTSSHEPSKARASMLGANASRTSIVEGEDSEVPSLSVTARSLAQSECKLVKVHKLALFGMLVPVGVTGLVRESSLPLDGKLAFQLALGFCIRPMERHKRLAVRI